MKYYNPIEVDATPVQEGIDRIMVIMLPHGAQVMGLMELDQRQKLLIMAPAQQVNVADVDPNETIQSGFITHEQRMFVWIRRGSGLSLPKPTQVPKFIAKLEDYLVPSEFSAHSLYNGVKMTLYLFEILDSSPPIKPQRLIGRRKPDADTT